MRHRFAFCCALAVAALAALTGCAADEERPEPIQIDRATAPEYFVNTVGQRAFVTGGEPVLVQGVGLVVGLNGTGSTTHPPGLRNRMLKVIAALRLPTSVLSDPDTAAVYISGFVPPGSRKGDRFDLVLMAAPNTQTTSLEGGRLLECDLYRVETTRAGPVTGSILAYGSGELFVSPFRTTAPPSERREAAGMRSVDGPASDIPVPAPSDAAPDDTPRTDPRVGWILGGGDCRYTRDFFLNLLEPSERTAQQIVRHVNARFPRAAEGNVDPGQVDLTVPPAYNHDKPRFLKVVRSIFLVDSPSARERRMRELAEALASDADPDSVVAGLEAFGRPVLPLLRPMLDSANLRQRYFAAETMCRLDDPAAVETMKQFALDDTSPYQERAIRSLGELSDAEGATVLEDALEVQNPAARIAAYQALRKCAPTLLDYVIVPRDVEVAVVPTRGDPFVYVSRQMQPRIVVFGNVYLDPPVLIDTPRFLVSAQPGESGLALMSKIIGPPSLVRLPLRLAPVLTTMVGPPAQDPSTGRPLGLDLTYSDAIALLDRAYTSGALEAPIVYEPLRIALPTGGQQWAGPADTSGDIIVPEE